MAEVLLIDAEQPFAGDVKGQLEGRGFTVTQLDDGKEGLEYARGNAPDLIVLCVELPKMSGYSICNKLKKDSALKAIPLIITSSEATPETFAQHKKLKTRAEDYLIKPFELDALVEKIGGQIELPSGGPPEPPPDDDDFGDALGALDEIGADEVQLDDALDDLKIESAEAADAEPEQVDELDGEESLDLGGLGDGDDGLGEFDGGGDDGDDLLSGLGGDDGDDLLAGLGGDDSDDPLAGLGDDDPLAGLGDDSGEEGLPDLDDAFEEIAAPEDDKPSDKPSAPAEVPDAAPAAAGMTSAADLQAMNALRRENTELKASVSELEHKLKAAEDAAKSSKEALESAKSGSTSSARETLDLKKEIRNKEKELMELKDEIFKKEEAVVELQEELDAVRSASDEAVAGAAEKDATIARLEAKAQALTEERDALEAQVGDRLASAEAENNDLKEQLSRVQGELTEARAELDGKLQALEQENQETGEQLVEAYNRIKTEEGLRDKAKDALNIALALLSGEVEDNNGESVGIQPDA